MTIRALTPLALTIDDAPSIAAGRAVQADPRRMDALRERLQFAGVAHCVAFVVSDWAQGHEPSLERWLAAGYELGNHSADHAAPSRSGPAAAIASFERCDARLARVGAFAHGRARYYRFPYGDRGGSPDDRRALLSALSARDYLVAEVSVSLPDYVYEDPLALALRAADAGSARRIEQRFLDASRAELLRPPRGVAVQIAALHFGLVALRCAEPLLDLLGTHAALRPLHEAATLPDYTAHARDLARNGIYADHVERTPLRRALRKLTRASERLGLFEQDQLGPRWPHWSR